MNQVGPIRSLQKWVGLSSQTVLARNWKLYLREKHERALNVDREERKMHKNSQVRPQSPRETQEGPQFPTCLFLVT